MEDIQPHDYVHQASQAGVPQVPGSRPGGIVGHNPHPAPSTLYLQEELTRSRQKLQTVPPGECRVDLDKSLLYYAQEF